MEKAWQGQEGSHEQGPVQVDCFPPPTCTGRSGKVGLGALKAILQCCWRSLPSAMCY